MASPAPGLRSASYTLLSNRFLPLEHWQDGREILFFFVALRMFMFSSRGDLGPVMSLAPSGLFHHLSRRVGRLAFGSKRGPLHNSWHRIAAVLLGCLVFVLLRDSMYVNKELFRIFQAVDPGPLANIIYLARPMRVLEWSTKGVVQSAEGMSTDHVYHVHRVYHGSHG